MIAALGSRQIRAGLAWERPPTRVESQTAPKRKHQPLSSSTDRRNAASPIEASGGVRALSHEPMVSLTNGGVLPPDGGGAPPNVGGGWTGASPYHSCCPERARQPGSTQCPYDALSRRPTTYRGAWAAAQRGQLHQDAPRRASKCRRGSSLKTAHHVPRSVGGSATRATAPRRGEAPPSADEGALS